MTRKILLGSIVTAFIFSGCLGFGEAKPDVEKVTKAKNKVEAKVDKATKSVKETTKKVETAKKTVKDSMPTPPESLLKDKVIEEAVVIGEENTPKVIESVD